MSEIWKREGKLVNMMIIVVVLVVIPNIQGPKELFGSLFY